MGFWSQVQAALRRRLRPPPLDWEHDSREAEIRQAEARRQRISRLVREVEAEVQAIREESNGRPGAH